MKLMGGKSQYICIFFFGIDLISIEFILKKKIFLFYKLIAFRNHNLMLVSEKVVGILEKVHHTQFVYVLKFILIFCHEL